jgi:hypothetical protein
MSPKERRLDDYATDDSGERPPSVRKRKPVSLPKTNRQVGTLVWDHSREWNAYMSPRDEEENLFHKYNAYPISTPLLGRLQSYEVERVLIPVRDDTDYGHGTVYEFDLSAYYPENSPTYEWDRDGDVDVQVCPDKDDDSRYVWRELGSDLFYSAV